MIVRTGIIAGTALLLAIASVSISAAGIFRVRSPASALALAPWDARAQANLAQQTLFQPKPGQSPEPANAQARLAYAHEPLSIEAVTAVGMAAARRGDNARATAIFAYAERLSRRDVGTQLWLIQNNVARNNIEGALAHYNIVLSTAPDARASLSAILINASSQPNIAVAVNRLMLTRPNWRDDFLTRFAFDGRDAVALAAVSRHVFDLRVGEDRDVFQRVLARYVGLARYDLAWDAYQDVMRGVPGARPDALLRDGDFTRDDGLPPFDWRYPAEGRLVPERRPMQGSGRSFALYLPADADHEAETATQMIRLPAGSYELGATVGDTAGDQRTRPFLRVRCAAEPNQDLAAADFPQAPSQGRAMATRFVVPANCPFQWLSIWVRGNSGEAAGTTPWITAISLRQR